MADSVSPVCARFHHAVELIGGRWTGAIIRTLLQGKTRYATIKSAIPDLTDRMLSDRLRSLEAEGLVTREVIPETPVRVEYELTEKGRSLEKALNEIGIWAERWIPGDSTAHKASASPRTPVLDRGQSASRPPLDNTPFNRGPRIRAR